MGSNAEYALYVETGTGLFGPKGQRIVPKKAKVLRFTGKKGIVFAASTKGMHAQPYLRPALIAVSSA